MGVSREASRIGIDLSGPVRAVLISKASARVIASMTAQTGFEPDSRESLAALAREIREFWRPFEVRPDGVAGLPVSSCLLFTVPMQPLSKKELKQAMYLQVERMLPGGSSTMRMAAKEWPADLPVPPASGVSQGNKTYVVAAAESVVVLAAENLMKMAGVRPVGVEVPAIAACRGSRWMWAKRMDLEVAATSEEDQPSESGTVRDFDPGEEVRLNMALVVNPSEALLYLAFDACPWLKREIALDPDNPFVNAQIVAGEISRSARFAAGSLPAGFTAGVTVMGSSDRTGFLADYLKEQSGIRVQVWGAPAVNCSSEYGVAAGLALPKEGVTS